MAAKKNPTLEQQFRDAVKEVEDKLAEAGVAFKEAGALARKHGITLSMNYRDIHVDDVIGVGYEDFFSEKWDDLDKALMSELTGIGRDDWNESGGWMHSSC